MERNASCWNGSAEAMTFSSIIIFQWEHAMPQGHSSITEMTPECKLFWGQVAFHFYLNAFIRVLYFKFGM